MTQLIAPEGRQFFFTVVANRFEAERKFDPKSTPGRRVGLISVLQQAFTERAIAALDLGLGALKAQAQLAEAARASVLTIEHEEDPTDAYFRLIAFFLLFVTGDQAALEQFAKHCLTRRRSTAPMEALMEGLLDALVGSVLGDNRLLNAGLATAEAAAVKVKKPKGNHEWATSLVELARTCLVGKGKGLETAIAATGQLTRALYGNQEHFGRLNFNAYLAQVPLAFVGRAKTRGLALPKSDPDACMVLSLFEQKPRALPAHPWHTFPPADAAMKKAVTAALKQAKAPAKRKR